MAKCNQPWKQALATAKRDAEQLIFVAQKRLQCIEEWSSMIAESEGSHSCEEAEGNRTLNEAINYYWEEQVKNVSFAMRSKLPRELRDEIYQYFLHTEEGTYNGCVGVFTGELFKQTLAMKLRHSDDPECSWQCRCKKAEYNIPCWWDEKIVGKAFILEAVTHLYRMLEEDGWKQGISPRSIHGWYFCDVFDLGIVPSDHIRKANILISLHGRDWDDHINKDQIANQIANALCLLRIPNKNGFQLKFTAHFTRTRVLNLGFVKHVIDGVGQIVQEFEKANDQAVEFVVKYAGFEVALNSAFDESQPNSWARPLYTKLTDRFPSDCYEIRGYKELL